MGIATMAWRGTGAGLALLGLLLGAAAEAADPAAQVTMLTGRGTVSSNDGVRPLAKGDPVFSGEVVSSGPNSYLNLKFADGGFVLLRPNTRFQIEEFTLAPAVAAAAAANTPAAPNVTAPPKPPAVVASGNAGPESSRALFRLLRGGFRAVSGLVGKTDRNEYRVATPVATIGIRGTDFLAVICDATCANDPVVLADMPAGEATEGGLVAGVIQGGIGVRGAKSCSTIDPTQGDTCELTESQYLLVTKDGTPRRLASMPRFLQVDPLPNPLTCSP